MTLRGRMLRRYGPDVEPWLDRLPGLLDDLAARWGLVLGEPFGGGNSGATLCALRDGVPVVLKVFPRRPRSRAGRPTCCARSPRPAGSRACSPRRTARC
ncbi:hypothetical protein ACFQV2_09630 [Actinokineospora soli]|uniref:Uncharacterized protein n=1 Tax=Actinokineospora soli TaxID=1048753 RepID=A0ABW2TLS1_9PSEU